MKKETHPQYVADAKITCACGAVFAIGGTQKELSVEICSTCHPFYTGAEKSLDAAGRVEKFKARKSQAKTDIKSKSTKKAEKKDKRVAKKA
ncbi:MAG: hypothetical protein RJA61_589 [Candidatus Parcubacteria bacterium]|jgi:large subunit ribosomal protein L31